MSPIDATDAAAHLRQEFDESFAVAVREERDLGESFLRLRVQRSTLAVRVSEIAAVARCPALTPLPSQNPSVLGLVGLRGGLVVVHSLADLVGEPRGKLDEQAILLLCAGEPSVGLLADELLGHLHVATEAIHAGFTQGGWSNAIVSAEGSRCPVASIPLLLAVIRQSTSAERGSDET